MLVAIVGCIGLLVLLGVPATIAPLVAFPLGWLITLKAILPVVERRRAGR